MRKLAIIILAWLALAPASMSAHADAVGRVLLAVGDVAAVRAGKTLPLATGTMIEDKDTLRTGAASNLQVRFTDNSVLSLRDNSEFAIEEYRFSSQTEGLQRAFYRLLKGGLRTITGLIGHTRHEDYRIDSIVATIGIRGTHFALILCQAGNCLNADGSTAMNGLYGRTTDGIVAVVTRKGEFCFGAGETFFIASIDGPAEQLIAPPDFLSDRLEGQKHGRSSGGEHTTAGGIETDSRPNVVPAPLPQLQFVTTETLSSQGTPAALPPPPVVVPLQPITQQGPVFTPVDSILFLGP